jgi:hypothetical protein
VDLGRLGRAEQGAFAKTKGSLPTETNGMQVIRWCLRD